jgi:hypothetical protein
MFRNTVIVLLLAGLAGVLLLCGCGTTPLPPVKSAELRMPLSEFISPNASESVGGPGMATEGTADTDLMAAGVQYIGIAERVEKQIAAATGVDDSLRVKYYECAEGAIPADVKKTEPNIVAYVTFNRNVLEAVNRRAIRIPDVVYPKTGYSVDRIDSVTLPVPGYEGGEVALMKSVFYNGLGDWILVYYIMDRNGDIVSRDKVNALKNWQRLPESERKGFLAQVEFYTIIGRGGAHPQGMAEEEILKAELRMDKFVPLFLAKLTRFLPEPVR